MAHKMGYEGLIYYGVAGSAAATQLTNVRDVSYNLEPDKGDTTQRGTGAAPPIKSGRVVAVGVSIEWTMLEKTTDTALEALKVAAFAGSPVAIRLKDYAAVKGYDGDCDLTAKKSEPIGGEQTWQFTATPNAELRAPQLYV